MDTRFFWRFRHYCRPAKKSSSWLLEAKESASNLPLRRGQRVLARQLFRKVREIHCRLSLFYSPYATRNSWLDPIATESATPEALLLATRWLLKKHAAVAAEFRSLESSLARLSFDEIAPGSLLETGTLLDTYVEKTAFRFSEETLANTINDWQTDTGSLLSLSETEALSPLLRLLSLDKLSAVALELAEIEHARAAATKWFTKFGPNRSRFEREISRTLKKHGDSYARAFSETFAVLLSKEEKPFSRFRDGSTGGESTASGGKMAREPEGIRNISTRTRILLRSLSLLGEFEWNTLLRKTNALHKLLIRDPGEVYARMTTLSQELYRKKAASLARALHVPEETLANAALSLAHEANDRPKTHIGYYLIGDGLPLLVKRLTGRSHLSWWYWYHDRERLPIIRKLYFFAIFGTTLSASVLFAVFFLRYHFLILLITPIIYKVSKHLTDTLFVGAVPPTFLPRINFRRSIPESVPAVFVIPALLTDKKRLESLMGKLETAFLSNPGNALSYGLLLDFRDATSETLPEDEHLLEETRRAFRRLNDRYGETDRFFFFFRSRVWSEQQERWMGWERKRGKLLDLARALRGRPVSSPFFFSSASIPKADFVITLDEDAFITRDFIKDMLGIHTHPLQHPLLGHNGELLSGYTFIQPHVKQWFKNRHHFRLPRIFFDEKRFSAYSSVFPEVYQDVFLEGSYAGKGSFHVDAFLGALDHTLPTDQVLSHDLLEGAISRTAYAADIDIFDEFPKSLRALLSRSHRWTRGDWQIIDWLFGTVRNEHGKKCSNTLCFIHRFKIADNLLQSLSRPTIFALTLIAWFVGNDALLLFAWGIFFADLFLLDASIDWFRWVFQLLTGQWKHLGFRFRRTFLRSLRLFRQALFECVILPYAALDTIHAIATALIRRYGHQKNMLEWVPSSHSENPAEREPLLFPILALLVVSGSLFFELHIHPFLGAILISWMTIPALVFALNRPYKHPEIPSRETRNALRKDALETWSFFADTVTTQTHFLPPDYVRYEPTPSTATYTSITNIGFFLTSVMVAQKLGFISLSDAHHRIERTLQTLSQLEQYEGHFYNWYNTDTALPAPPLFISSVDSGNLLAALITLRQWISLERKPLSPSRTLEGLHDMAHLVADRIPQTLEMQSFADFWEAIVDRIDHLPVDLSSEAFGEHISAILTSLSGILTPKALPESARTIFDLFHTRIIDARAEYGANPNASPAPFDPSSLTGLERLLDMLIAKMRFDFLKSNKRSLISIGYHVPTKRLETRSYQTLASEARIANLLALAQGTLSFRGWNKLNRTVLALPEGPALISWTGTLFEYLMPAIFLEEHPDSLVGKSIRTAIRANIRFAKKRSLPVWGLSESGYAELDRSGNYRYKPFGLPSLSLSPSSDDRPTVSAYSIAMSLPYFRRDALKNLERYSARGGKGAYGYIEAIDFFRTRHGSPVRMFMSHHQGMILSAIGNILCDHFLTRLFESHPLIQNSLFVLDEGIPPIDREPFPRPAPLYLYPTLIHPRTP